MRDYEYFANDTPEIREKLINHIRFGHGGECIENDELNRKIKRADNFTNTLPYCYCFQNGRCINYGEKFDFETAIKFVFGEINIEEEN